MERYDHGGLRRDQAIRPQIIHKLEMAEAVQLERERRRATAGTPRRSKSERQQVRKRQASSRRANR